MRSKRKQRANLKQSYMKKPTYNLPKGLVGSKCTALVKIAGVDYSCLLDTGSQVTTIPESFYKQHLSGQDIKPLNNLLEVEGAAGQSVPYLGYIEVAVTFPKDFLEIDIEIPTLALVVPDVHSDSQSLLLMGTNTLDVLYERYSDIKTPNHQPGPYGYRAVLNILELRQKQNRDGSVGLVKMLGKTPVVIPAGHTVVLEGSANIHNPSTDKWITVEHPTESSLPGGLCVQSCLITLPANAPHKVPVAISNESEQDVTIPPICVIAELGAFRSILSQHSVINAAESKETSKSDLSFNFGDSPIPPEWKERVTKKLNEKPEVFAHHDLDFGCTDKVKHHIKLHDDTPFKHRARPIYPQDIEAVRKHLQELLEAGVIRESESPYSSPIVVVRKRNNDVRLCIDYRKLNLQTVKDAYALPNLEDTFSALTGSKWFTVLDLKSGYYQIEVDEADKAKTAFVTPLGFWEFNRMPQGITNAPSTFQRLMEKCVGDMNLKEVLVFLDDLIIFSETLEEHESRLMRVLARLKEYGLKLSPEKCKFFQTRVRYLGHIVSEDGVETDSEKLEALKTWPIPKNLKELKSFLGFSGYYRRFIKDYAAIIRPLNDLTRGYPPLRKHSKVKVKSDQYHDPRQPFEGRWTCNCQRAFETIIEKLTTAPVLGFADSKLPYMVHTDASTTGLGAALYQEQEGKLKAIAFASRGLSRSESRYPAHKLEFLALKWSVTEKFHDYLYGNDFTVVTDSNPLTYILTTARLDATGYRWLAALSNFSFKLQYRAGKQNLDADGLSRRPHGELLNDAHSKKEQERIARFTKRHLADTENQEVLNQDAVKAICESQLVVANDPCSSQCGIALVESLTVSADAIPESFVAEGQHGLPVIPPLSHSELKEKQRADSTIREVIAQMELGEKTPPTVRRELPDLPLLLREWNRLELCDDVLYRKRQAGDQVTYQLVLPEVLRASVLQSLHNDMGHMGIDRTLDLVRTRFYWPRLSADVERKVKTCDRCTRRKRFPEKAAPLVTIKTTRPLELVCMDFLSIEPDCSNTKDILVLTDHFTKFVIAVPTPNQKARTVAKCLWDNFIVCYGIPERLHSDQGPDFESRLIKELCEVAGIQKSRTTPYHPRGNPVERFNRTLLSMLGTLENKQKSHWKEFVKPLVHAYNCTRNDVTGFTPYELMFGRKPRLPVDLAYGLPLKGDQRKSHSQYVQDLRSRLEEGYQLASRNAQKVAERNKTGFDKKVTATGLEIGDRVLVRNVRLRGKHKLADKWEADVHIVVKRAGDLPVYTVRPENREGPTRTLHRDLLLSCSFLPMTAEEEPPQPKPVRRPRTRQTAGVSETEAADSSDMEDNDEIHWLTEPPSESTPRFTAVHDCPNIMREETTKTNPDVSLNPDFLLESTSVHQLVEGPHSHEIPDTEEQDVTNPADVEDPDEMITNGNDSLTDHSPQENLPDGGYVSAQPENTNLSNVPGELVDNLGTSPDGPCHTSNVSGGKERRPGPNSASDEMEIRENKNDNTDDNQEAESLLRRSQRHRERPKRFHYPQIGNPLISIVQALFQGLTVAYTDVLSEISGPDSEPGQPPPVVTIQPSYTCNGTCMGSRGEGVTQVTKKL